MTCVLQEPVSPIPVPSDFDPPARIAATRQALE